MEVHPHAHTPRKKWHHYFWEFFMLFLAVTLGFFVENQREHRVDHKHEVQYIKSLVEDMEADTLMLVQRYDGVTVNRIKRADSLWKWMNSPGRLTNIHKIYFETAEAFRHGKYKFHDRTIVQLKNAGGMRLIENVQVTDSINTYYNSVSSVEAFDELIHNYIEKLTEIVAELFSAESWANANLAPNIDSLDKEKLSFLSKDPTLINRYCTFMFMYKNREGGLRNTAILLKARAVKMIAFIKKAYHLD